MLLQMFYQELLTCWQYMLQPAWIQVLNSDATYPQAQQLSQKLAIASPDAAGFILHRGLIRHNNNIQIGQNSDL
jgi:hypothetical protein